MSIQRLTAIGDVAPDAWDALLPDDNPFVSHAFLSALEQSGCVSTRTGWQPQHLVLKDEGGKIEAAMPLYIKSHSHGEFVFDWAWADAYQQTGLNYYPKLLCASPFSPVRGARLLGHKSAALPAASRELAETYGYSSLHVLFTEATDDAVFESENWLLRTDCQFHWHNEDYADFDEFLAGMRSERRRKIRRERRTFAEQNFEFTWLKGHELNSRRIALVHELLATTYRVRGRLPYLNTRFFELIARLAPEAVRVLLVTHGGREIACAFFLQSGDSLYGRYWGSDGHYPLLHFEACYYQGIEYCIEQGLRNFDPGTQGEHKLLRGFNPREVHSWHWIRHPAMSVAIADYLQRERKLVNNYIEQCRQSTPFKKNAG